MAKRSKRYAGQRTFAKSVAFTIAGGVAGLVAQKLVSDVITRNALPNPTLFSTVQLADAIQAGTEYVAGYYLGKSEKRKKKLAGNFLVAMGTGVVIGDVYQWVAQQPAWLRTSGTMRLSNNGQGRYGRTAPVSGAIGAYLKPVSWAYAPR